ncbi:MAG: hypothetical protein A2X94_08975 [Bdellovibrionales bacterium GWB1_55_8]|nr:MAG: hypothetical protein A2X94_08975 [Bdellovibrionales bacterium GWB1_55_8]
MEKETGKGVKPVTEKKPERQKLDRNVVVLTQGPDRVLRLDKERIVLGSVVSADVRLVGDGIAPIHAVIEFSGTTATIYDLASETGVFVNGRKVVTQGMNPGDKIIIGSRELEFRIESALAADRERFWQSEGRKLFVNPAEDFTPLLLESERDVQQIFDFRPTQKQALEVVMSWSEVILDVAHFVQEKAVLIGDRRECHFAIPSVLSSRVHPLVSRLGETYVLNIDPRMKGVIFANGEIQPLSRFGQQVTLARDGFAKISVDDVSFYLSFTAAPPRLRTGKMLERDPLLTKIFVSSMLLTGLIVFSLLSAHVPANIEAEQIPERIATILYQPEKYTQFKRPVPREPVKQVTAEVKPREKQVEPPKPKVTKLDITPKASTQTKPVPKILQGGEQKKANTTVPAKSGGGSKVAQDRAKEGEGARAKGKEGSRGTPKAQAKTQTPQSKAFRPSPEGGAGRGSGNSQVADEGNVDFLKSASGKIENILGNSSARLGKGGEKLMGFGGFNTVGSGGLALSGSGSGGGGTAESLGGLSDKGRGGGRVGTGMGAAGSGTGIVGGQARVVIRSGGPEEAVVMGSIDADAVEAALLAHRDEFRLCYERELNAESPNIAGRVGTSFVIGSTGKVAQAGIASSSLKNSNAEACILSVIRRIQFPVPRGAGVVQVSYPFKFVSR